MQRIHFISGLPRSGSTLLAALLRQNPRFEAGMSGPLAGLFGALLGQMSAGNEFSVFIDDTKRERILRGLFDAALDAVKAESKLPAYLPPPPKGRTVVVGAGKARGAWGRLGRPRASPGCAGCPAVLASRGERTHPAPCSIQRVRISFCRAVSVLWASGGGITSAASAD